MDNAKLSRIYAHTVAVTLLVTNLAYAQGTIQYSWQGPVEMLPNAISLGGDTGEFRFNETRSNGLKFTGLRGSQVIPNSFRLRLPPSPGAANTCLKISTGTAMSDNIYDYPLYFDACTTQGADWITAIQDGSSNNHVSTVYSPNQGDRVGWRVLRSRGTVNAPENTLVNDIISAESFEALIGGSVFPVISNEVQRLADTATARGSMTFRTYNAMGQFFNKLTIGENILIQDGHLGDVTTRVPKIWVQDFDCAGVGCPAGGGGFWSRNSAGFLYPTTTTDDVRITNKLKWRDNSQTPPADLDFDSYAVIGTTAQARYLVFRDNAGAEILKMERIFAGVSSKRAIFDSSVDPTIDLTYPLGAANKRWKTLFVQDLDCTGNCGFWSRNSGTGKLAPNTTTDDVRVTNKLEFQDQSLVTTLNFDMYAVVGAVAGNRYLVFRDNAGDEMLKLSRITAGAVDKSATFDSNVHPLTSNTYSLGADAKRWKDARITDLYTLGIRTMGTSIDVFSNLVPSPTDNRSLGSSDTNRWLKLWVKDIDAYGTTTTGTLNVTNINCTGICPGASYWSRDTTNGYVYPTTKTDDVRIKNKLVLEDPTPIPPGTGLAFDIKVSVGNIGDRWMSFRDNGGFEMLRLERMFTTTTTNVATFDMSVVPKSNGNRNLGDTTNYWGDLRVNDTYTIALRPKSATYLDVFGGMYPSTDNSANFTLGSATKRWYQVYAMGVQTNGLSGVGGSGQVLSYGHFIPATTATYTLGTAALRWNYLYASNMDVTNFSISNLSVSTLTVSGNSTIGGTLGVSSTLTVGSTLTTRAITPFSDAQYGIGGSGSRYTNLYLSGTAFLTGLSGSGSAISVQSALTPNSGNTHDLGSSSARFRTLYAQDVNFTGSMTANGSVGMSRTAYATAGCFMQFQLGILINSNC